MNSRVWGGGGGGGGGGGLEILVDAVGYLQQSVDKFARDFFILKWHEIWSDIILSIQAVVYT